jgi:hypothetical protein
MEGYMKRKVAGQKEVDGHLQTYGNPDPRVLLMKTD